MLSGLTRAQKIILISSLILAISSLSVLYITALQSQGHMPSARRHVLVNYTNEIAQKCSQYKNTPEQNEYLDHGRVILYFRAGYPVADIQNFISRNQYQIDGEIYSELQGKHSVYIFVPEGEEFCWARELEKVEGVESVMMPSTLRPD